MIWRERERDEMRRNGREERKMNKSGSEERRKRERGGKRGEACVGQRENEAWCCQMDFTPFFFLKYFQKCLLLFF